MRKITIGYRGEIATQENYPEGSQNRIHMEIEEKNEDSFVMDVSDLGTFHFPQIRTMMTYDSLHKKAQKRMWQIISVSVFCLLLDIVLFFVAPYLVVYLGKPDIDFSPIPFGATISICGMQAAWISALFYEYRQESTKADYIFRGREAYPNWDENS